jgi:membrane fusion protein, multidrug efflux system
MKNISLLIIITLALISCRSREIPAELKVVNNENRAIYKVVHKSMTSSITIPGEFMPFEEVELFPKVNGFVKDVLVDRGNSVKKGQTLLLMEAPEIEQQLILAKSKLAESEAILSTKKERNDRLTVTSQTPGSVSPFDLESAHNDLVSSQASVKTEEANVAAYKAMSDYLNMRAPFDGIITQRNVHPGAFVGPNSQFKEPVLVLKQVNKLRLTVHVPESYVNKIDEHRDVVFSINAIPYKEFKGRISRSSKSVNNQTRSEAIEIDIINEPDIKPGMYAEVKLPVTASGINSFIVPYSAILTNTERKYIVVLDKQKHVHFVDIREGITDGKTTEVFGNIEDNVDILTKPDNDIKEGDMIE